MRITENLLMNGFLQRTARSLSAMTKAQQQISSGKLLERPSDDPIALARSLALRSDLKRVEAYSDKVSSATAFISTTEGSLQEVSDLLSRAKELLIEATNAPSEGVAAGAHSQELRSMIDELLLVANRDIGGRYLFAGRQTSERPYAKIGQSIAYQGDGQDVLEEIGPGLRVALNMTGPAAFQTVPSRIEGSVDLDPAISEITPLRDLFQGNGAAAGPIQITDSNGV
ncbi:MAG: flagellar hook-associated protein FlgL, partial [Gemmatimonadetes bacterium]|nr:flagellar hook-associated protein FlgL [Gemmatimonadota bacterium]